MIWLLINYLQILFLCSKLPPLLPLLTSKSTTSSSARSQFSRDPPTIPSGLLTSNLLSNPYLFGDSSIDLLPMMPQLLETKLNGSPLIREFVALLPISSMILFFIMCLITMLLQLLELQLILLSLSYLGQDGYVIQFSRPIWIVLSVPSSSRLGDSYLFCKWRH